MSAKQELAGLDMMRAIAALCVVLVHSSSLFGQQLAPGAYLAVDFFFALSGYVIAHAYDHRPMGLKAFAIRRVARLYPLYAMGLLLALALNLIAIATDQSGMELRDVLISFLLNAFYLPSPFGGKSSALFPLNTPAWSLFFELIVNLLYATAVFRIRRSVWALCALSAAMLVFATCEHGDADMGWQWSYIHIGLLKVVFSFSAGVCIRRYLPPCRMALRGAAMFIPFGLLSLSLIWPVEREDLVLRDLTFILVLSPFLVWLCASMQPKGWVASVFKRLGGASYAVYITHLPLMYLCAFVGHRLHIPPTALGVIFATGVFAWGVWLERVYDGPVRAWLQLRLTARER